MRPYRRNQGLCERRSVRRLSRSAGRWTPCCRGCRLSEPHARSQQPCLGEGRSLCGGQGWRSFHGEVCAIFISQILVDADFWRPGLASSTPCPTSLSLSAWRSLRSLLREPSSSRGMLHIRTMSCPSSRRPSWGLLLPLSAWTHRCVYVEHSRVAVVRLTFPLTIRPSTARFSSATRHSSSASVFPVIRSLRKRFGTMRLGRCLSPRPVDDAPISMAVSSRLARAGRSRAGESGRVKLAAWR